LQQDAKTEDVSAEEAAYNREPAAPETGEPAVADASVEEFPQNPDPQPDAPAPVRCEECGEEIPAGEVFCSACGAPVPLAAAPVGEALEPEAPREKMPKKLKIFLITASVLILIACIVGGIALAMSSSSRGGRTPDAPEQPMVYIQDEKSMKFIYSNMNAPETLSDSYYSEAGASELESGTHLTTADGRYLLYFFDYRVYYYQGVGDLYLRDLTQHTGENKPTDRGEKIASDVVSFGLSEDGGRVYYIDTKQNLYAWSFEGDPYLLDNDVGEVIDCKGDKLLYYKGDTASSYAMAAPTQDIFVASLAPDSGYGDKIAGEISSLVSWNEDFSKFVYTKTKKGSEGTTYDVYLAEAGSTAETVLIRGVDKVLDADADAGTVVYLLEREISFTLEDMLDDDMLDSDSALEPPNIQDYPMLLRLYGESYGMFSGYSYDPYGYGYDPYGYDPYYNYDYDPYGYGYDPYGYGYDPYGYGYGFGGYADPYYDYYYSDVYDDEAFDYSQMLREKEEFDRLQKEYQSKILRDELREKVQDNIFSFMDNTDLRSYDLYYLKDGERLQLDSGLYQKGTEPAAQAAADIGENWAVYLKMDIKGSEKLKMSEISENMYSYSWSIGTQLEEKFQGQLYIVFLDGEPIHLKGEEDTLVPDTSRVMLTDEKDGVYYMLTEEYSKRRLYYASIAAGKAGDPELIDDNASGFIREDRYREQLIYTSGSKTSTYDIYTLAGGTRDRIGYDISRVGMSVVNGGQTLCFYEEYNSAKDSGDLYIVAGGEKTFVANDVHSYYYRSDGLIYLLRNYRSGMGDLYVFDGERITLVDYDVTAVLVN